MIRLILNPDSDRKVFSFTKKEILIGSSSNPQADVPIGQEKIAPIHFKIVEKEGQFFLNNYINDPFATLNDQPFGKKLLRSCDRIETNFFTIQFEVIEEGVPSLPLEAKPPDPPIPAKQDFSEIDILVKEVENIEQKDRKATSKETKYYVQEADDESESWKEGSSAKPQPPTKSFISNWKAFIALMLGLFAFCVLLGSGAYFRASGKNSQEEKKIGAGIADIAMALTQARLNRITPDNQNWTDPDFLRNILPRVISPTLHTQAQINNQGQFTRYPYYLRIYTSRNMERFLVMAQPAPHFMQWLLHKTTIVIDSETMEMRKITDLKELNRLLSSPNPLEEKNGKEIKRVLKGGTLMSLSSLAGYKNHWGFTPPRALGFIRPGGENYIYNAPRYYPFGEELLKKAIDLYSTASEASDVAILQEEMNEISKFPDIVLYTSQGLQVAVEAQKALTTLAPHSKFLVAYVKFNPKGIVTSSHLLMNEDQDELAFLNSPHQHFSSLLSRGEVKQEEQWSMQSDPDPLLNIEEDRNDQDSIDHRHPLYLQLETLYSGRKKALHALSGEILQLLNRQNQLLTPGFQEKFQELVESYLKTDHQHYVKIVQELEKLSHEYSGMPLSELIKFVDEAGLSSFAQEALDTHRVHIGPPALTHVQIESTLEKINETATLSHLHNLVLETFNLLTLNYLPDPNRLIFYQNLMHTRVLQKLKQLILSPTSPYISRPFELQDRATMIHILEKSWVNDPGEYDYFLAEFDHFARAGE